MRSQEEKIMEETCTMLLGVFELTKLTKEQFMKALIGCAATLSAIVIEKEKREEHLSYIKRVFNIVYTEHDQLTA